MSGCGIFAKPRDDVYTTAKRGREEGLRDERTRHLAGRRDITETWLDFRIAKVERCRNVASETSHYGEYKKFRASDGGSSEYANFAKRRREKRIAKTVGSLFPSFSFAGCNNSLAYFKLKFTSFAFFPASSVEESGLKRHCAEASSRESASTSEWKLNKFIKEITFCTYTYIHTCERKYWYDSVEFILAVSNAYFRDCKLNVNEIRKKRNSRNSIIHVRLKFPLTSWIQSCSILIMLWNRRQRDVPSLAICRIDARATSIGRNTGSIS